LTPEEAETVCNFLCDASSYGVVVRTVEAPFIRRVGKQRQQLGDYWQDKNYVGLRTELRRFEGCSTSHSSLNSRGTVDGDGIIFVGYDGIISPGGLVPIRLGNLREDKLVRVYRENELLRALRARKMKGYCGICDFRESCGGSSARAYSLTGDPSSSDPACLWVKG
jgi:radical SAM protein with 4Fe4S-binding SPASM domain